MVKKPCVRCQRLIDPVARLCPYCNWDQELAAPRETPLATATAFEERDEERSQVRRRVARRVILIAGVPLLLIATFAIGGLVYQIGKPAPESSAEAGPVVASSPDRPVTDLTLVAVGELTSTVGRSITSVPPTTTLPAQESIGTERADTTALPSQQYAQAAELAEQTQQQPAESTVDPRTIAPPPPRPRPQPVEPELPTPREPPAETPRENDPPPEPSERVETRRTRPEPISQPIPEIDVDGTARFRLKIGTDGRVREVEVIQTIPGSTARLVSAIQQWRFRPATENGRPVEGIHLVDVSFNARNDED